MRLAVIGSLMLALYLVLKLRHWRPVLRPLGWVWPHTAYLILAPLLGVLLAAGVACLRLRGQTTPTMPLVDILILGLVLGPILEESFFRGFGALGVIHRDRSSLWLDSRDLSIHDCPGPRARYLQLGALCPGSVFISLEYFFGLNMWQRIGGSCVVNPWRRTGGSGSGSVRRGKNCTTVNN